MSSIGRILFLTLIVISCGSPSETSIPDDILPREKMIEVLTDIHIVEGAKVGGKIMGDTVTANVYYDKLYAKHHVSPEQFEESFSFYSTHPDIMAELYEDVIENLNKIEIVPPRQLLHEEVAREQDATAKTNSKLKSDSTKKGNAIFPK